MSTSATAANSLGVQRVLAPSERMFVGLVSGTAVRVRGSVDGAALGTALRALRRRYPLLGAYLESSEHGPVLVPPREPDGEIFTGSPATVEFEPWRAGRPQSAVCVEPEADGAKVSLLTHHCVADARHGGAAFEDLWRFYTEAVTHGSVAAGPELSPPEPIETLLAARGFAGISVEHDSARRFGATGAPDADRTVGTESPGRATIPEAVRHRFTVAETAAVADFCRRSELTAHGVLSGATLLAEMAVTGLGLTELYYNYPVDLRQWLTPAVAPAGGTNVIGYAQYNPGPAVAADLGELARSVNEELIAALSSGALVRSLIHAADSAATPPTAMPGKIMATNVGRVARFTTPPDCVVDDLTTVVSPRMFGQTNGRGLYAVSTFGDRLSIEIHHLPGSAEVESRRLQALVDQLLGACGQ